jgi:hypothetical protein
MAHCFKGCHICWDQKTSQYKAAQRVIAGVADEAVSGVVLPLPSGATIDSAIVARSDTVVALRRPVRYFKREERRWYGTDFARRRSIDHILPVRMP